MTEELAGRSRRWRSRVEAEELAAEYEASGVRREEFCRQKDIALHTRIIRRIFGSTAGPGRAWSSTSGSARARRTAQVPGDFAGILQTDGYAAYDRVGGPKLVQAACWAHYPEGSVIQRDSAETV